MTTPRTPTETALTAGPGLIFREADRGPAGNVCLGCGARLEKAHTWAECHAAIKAQSETWLENWLMETTSVDAGMVRGIRAERDAARAERDDLAQHVCDECNGNGIYHLDGVPHPCVCVSEPEGAELVRAEAETKLVELGRLSRALLDSEALIERGAFGENIGWNRCTACDTSWHRDWPEEIHAKECAVVALRKFLALPKETT